MSNPAGGGSRDHSGDAPLETAAFAAHSPAEALDWNRVLAWLPVLIDAGFQPGDAPAVATSPIGAHQLHPGAWSDATPAFVDDLYAAEVVASFDWPTWMQQNGRCLANNPEALADASLEDCWRLLAAHVRADRFVEGHLVSALQDGDIQATLTRISRLIGEGEPGSQ